MIIRADTKDFTFHSAATSAADGAAFEVGTFKTLTVDIDGTVTSATVEFKYKGANGVYKSLKGIKLSDWTTATSTAITTSAAETWQFDIAGLKTVIMDLSAITPGAGGSITVKGTAVT
ncbi:MAG: hypothetical protein Q8873_00540 [Bacillota bacterium]|nr:hypothetical protein [Bacillota bacterium]